MEANDDNQRVPAEEAGVAAPVEGSTDDSSAEPVSGGRQEGVNGSEAPAPSPEGETPSGEDGSGSGGYYEDEYGYEQSAAPVVAASAGEVKDEVAAPSAASGGDSPPPPVSAADSEDEDGDGDEEGMTRMSFLEHLQELRTRIVRSLMGIGAAFFISLIFAEPLWRIVSEPATDALLKLGFEDPKLAILRPMEGFQVIYIKLPILAAIFLSSPWVLYQVWAFIAPGLYRKERRWAAPFVLCSAGLFILGGLFAYFIAFRFGLVFLLGIGRDINILPIVSITEYFDLFVNITLGIGLVFELPILIFFLTLLRIVTPRFLLVNARYAILLITIIAAILTPTPDVVNLTLFAVPMVALYFVGIFASYLLFIHREGKRFPWRVVGLVLVALLAVGAGLVFLAVSRYGFRLVPEWPYIVR